MILVLGIACTGMALAEVKPRLVVLTDISPDKVEPDDMESIIRLFVHADLFEIDPLIHSTDWSTDVAKDSYYQLLHEAIDLYEKDLLFIWDESAWKHQNGTGRRKWSEYAAHVQGHGNSGKRHPKHKYGVDGDSPAFLHLMPYGLNDPDRPDQVGWGGFFQFGKCKDGTTSAYQNHGGSEGDASAKYQKYFYPATFNSFAARMDWAKDGKGNRNPIVVIDGNERIKILKKTPLQGSSVTLDASNSHDPDGDILTFNWWVLPEAGTYTGNVRIANDDASRATVQVPSDSAGKSFHVICEVTDDGTHALSEYRRSSLNQQTRLGLKNYAANSNQ